MDNFSEIFKKAFGQPLTTERLRIGIPGPEDAKEIAEFFHADNMAYVRELEWPAENVSYTPEYISDTVLPHLEETSRNRKLRLFISLPDTKQIIGEFSFWRDEQNRDMLYYFILPSQRRNGYAREVAGACLHRANENGTLHTIHAEVLPENEASKKLLRRLNFSERGPVVSRINRYQGQTLLSFEKYMTSPAPRLPAPGL